MTSPAELLERAAGDVPATFNYADVLARVRRRHLRRTWMRTVSVVGVIVALVSVALLGGVHHGGSRRLEIQIPAATPMPDVAVFDYTGNGGRVVGVIDVDTASMVARVDPIDGWRPGDQPFMAWVVANRIVVGWGDVYAAPISGGSSRLLGRGVFVPATEPGAVWLTSYGQVQVPTEELVDMTGRVLLAGKAPTPPGYTSGLPALTGVPGGIAFQASDGGIDIWDAQSGHVVRHLGTSPGATAAPAFGSTLAWCDDCENAAHITDLQTGNSLTLALPHDGRSPELGRARFSPDGTLLAVPVWPTAAPPGTTAEVLIFNRHTGQLVQRISTDTSSPSAAWSTDGMRLYVAANAGRLLVDDLQTGGIADLGSVPPGAGLLEAVVSDMPGSLNRAGR